MIQKIDKQHVQEAVQEAYERFKGVNEGKNADYIPYLANVCLLYTSPSPRDCS